MSRYTLQDWDVEDTHFWKTTGARIAVRNLIFSIFPEFLAFSIWQIWSVAGVYLPLIGFAFSPNQLFWLAALPGLAGATLRLPYAFMVPIMGGRNWTILSALLLLIPVLWFSVAIQDNTTTYTEFVIIALFCGLGGGNFASSMANINYFFPTRYKGLALGLNAAGGNIGVSAVQLLVPLAITMALFGSVGGNPQTLLTPGGGFIWLQNAALIWLCPTILAVGTSYFFMNNIAKANSSIVFLLSMFKDKHAWLMSILYTGTFGSFIGYSAGFPLLIKLQFPEENALQYLFLGPLVGSLIRPVGGWLADKWGGAKITFWNFIVMLAAVCGVLFFLVIKDKDGAFAGFFAMFMILFITTGIGNGSTYKMIPTIYNLLNKKQYGEQDPRVVALSNQQTTAVIGITAAIAAYGAFIVPKSYGTSIALTGNPQSAFLCFIVFYFLCIFITWFFYKRKNAEVPC